MAYGKSIHNDLSYRMCSNFFSFFSIILATFISIEALVSSFIIRTKSFSLFSSMTIITVSTASMSLSSQVIITGLCNIRFWEWSRSSGTRMMVYWRELIIQFCYKEDLHQLRETGVSLCLILLMHNYNFRMERVESFQDIIITYFLCT